MYLLILNYTYIFFYIYIAEELSKFDLETFCNIITNPLLEPTQSTSCGL